ncbi:hypothetical protein [Sphingomonas sp.]|uniref:hypothetical protein n=1 Tax=Sphingomonas sp. TaxID=28214 RepID=UPI003AFFFA96
MFEEFVRGAVQADRYLTAENVPYALNSNARSIRDGRWKADATSDIDIVAIRPARSGARRVLAINCKGGREELNIERDLARLDAANPHQTVAGGNVVTGFRELTEPDWACAFRQRVHAVTGQTEFTHVLAVKRIVGDRTRWSTHAPFLRLTPNLLLWDLQDLLEMANRPTARVFGNSPTRHLVDLIAAA